MVRGMIASIAAVLALSGAAAAQDAAGFSLEGSTRWRYEHLSGQFRAGGSGGDQGVYGRTFLEARYEGRGWAAGAELIDSRGYLNDAGSPLSTNLVNAHDLLQAYVELDAGAHTRVRLGRLTLDSGSRRFIARNNFRNTRNAFTGVEAVSRLGESFTLQLMALAPVQRRPSERARLLDNEFELDREAETQRFYGAHLTRAGAGARPSLETFLYVLDDGGQGADRLLFTPGARVLRPRNAGGVDFDLEGALQFGSRGALDVFGHTWHGHVGYTFEAALSPRIAVEIDHASGDDDAEDGAFNEYDRLFGLRREDFGETGIAGPFRRQNITSFGGRGEIREGRFDARMNLKAHWLASPSGAWGGAGVIDASGESGQFIGVYMSGRTRYRLVPDRVELEAGGGYLARGRFAKTAPNRGEDENTVYLYTMITLTL